MSTCLPPFFTSQKLPVSKRPDAIAVLPAKPGRLFETFAIVKPCCAAAAPLFVTRNSCSPSTSLPHAMKQQTGDLEDWSIESLPAYQTKQPDEIEWLWSAPLPASRDTHPVRVFLFREPKSCGLLSSSFPFCSHLTHFAGCVGFRHWLFRGCRCRLVQSPREACCHTGKLFTLQLETAPAR